MLLKNEEMSTFTILHNYDLLVLKNMSKDITIEVSKVDEGYIWINLLEVPDLVPKKITLQLDPDVEPIDLPILKLFKRPEVLVYSELVSKEKRLKIIDYCAKVHENKGVFKLDF